VVPRYHNNWRSGEHDVQQRHTWLGTNFAWHPSNGQIDSSPWQANWHHYLPWLVLTCNVGKTLHIYKGTNCNRHITIFLTDQTIPFIISIICIMLHVCSYLSAMHDMVIHVRSRLLMVSHVMIMHIRIMNIRIMHVMVRNLREMHIWGDMSGQGIIWQGT
jgi:hypothetical protein